MLKPLLKTMRLRQWTKNAILLAAIVFDRQFFVVPSLVKTFAGLILFCLLSSCIYIINDIVDVEADRAHPTKRNRPIAAGTLPVRVAVAACVVMLLLVFSSAFWLSTSFAIIALIYLLVNLAYSNWLKHIPIIDVMIIALGFVLRVAAGVSLIHIERFSPWLYVVTILGALYLGFGKRRAELALLQNGGNQQRKVLEGYTLAFLDQILVIVSSATLIAYSLYTFLAPSVPENHSLMLTIPIILYGIFRYLYLVQVKNEGGAPEELLLTDRPLQATVVLWGLTILAVFYLL
ncbi:MAG TPA: decaprenyl-phosphate phosphoribosyltransferase [Anaerolineaceae bacterium]|nr:decaprenyl-phosphate phosphoribosyltransferase [Anaerolineaceae bacterium]HPN51078.1 decaprenyl-phosphate phosphoribosyltransferase [Anaerolineaceae bacterium]